MDDQSNKETDERQTSEVATIAGTNERSNVKATEYPANAEATNEPANKETMDNDSSTDVDTKDDGSPTPRAVESSAADTIPCLQLMFYMKSAHDGRKRTFFLLHV